MSLALAVVSVEAVEALIRLADVHRIEAAATQAAIMLTRKSRILAEGLLDQLGTAAHALIPVCTCPQPSLRRVEVSKGVRLFGKLFNLPESTVYTIRV